MAQMTPGFTLQLRAQTHERSWVQSHATLTDQLQCI